MAKQTGKGVRSKKQMAMGNLSAGNGKDMLTSKGTPAQMGYKSGGLVKSGKGKMSGCGK